MERGPQLEQYLKELVQQASSTTVKGDAMQKLWPTMFVEMVRDCVLEMRDTPTYRRTCLSALAYRK